VEDWLRAADLFVFPSVFEALGIALVEAAACGLPALASRTGGIVDVVEDGASGLLIAPGDAGALAAGLRALAGDGDRRADMGREARRTALSRFDARDSLDRYRALFREISSPRSSSSRPGRAPRAGAAPPPSPAARA
jgi:glycosyltransferase involved in cell wall biosynthesis